MNFENAQRSPATALFLTTLLQSFLPVHSVSANVPDLMTETQFERCPKGSIYNGQQLTTMDGRSALDCMSRCARLAGCETVNVCPSDASGRVSCSLMSSGGQEGCQALTAAVSSSCFFARKVGLWSYQADERADWLIVLLTGWLSDWLSDWLSFWLVDWFVDWVTYWMMDRLVDWVIDWLIDWLIDCVFDWIIDWLRCLLIDCFVDCLTDCLIDWLID